jgi:hypothetical protein
MSRSLNLSAEISSGDTKGPAKGRVQDPPTTEDRSVEESRGVSGDFSGSRSRDLDARANVKKHERHDVRRIEIQQTNIRMACVGELADECRFGLQIKRRIETRMQNVISMS